MTIDIARMELIINNIKYIESNNNKIIEYIKQYIPKSYYLLNTNFFYRNE